MNIEVAQNFSTFKFSNKFIDDTNFASDYQQYTQINSIAYGAGYTNLRSSGLLFNGGLGFRKAGASLVYNRTNYLWDLQYIDFKVGAGYLYNRWSIKSYACFMPYYAYLLSAKQTSGLNYYDIKSDNALKSHDLGLLLNVGLKVALSYYTDLFAEYNYNLGLNNIETAPEQSLYNRGFLVKLGLAINITNFKKLQEQINKVPADSEVSVPAQNLSLATPSDNKVSDVSKVPAPGTQGWASNSNTQSKKNNSNIALDNPNSNLSNLNNDDNTSTAVPSDLDKKTIDEPQYKSVNISAANNNIDDKSDNTPTNNLGAANIKSSNNNIVSNSTTLATTVKSTPVESSTSSTNNKNTASAVEPIDNVDYIEDIPFEKTKTEEINFNKSAGIQVEKRTPSTTVNSKKKPDSVSEKKIPKNDAKIEFKVQLTAVKNSLRDGHPIYKNFKGEIKSEKGKDGWMRYYLGSYETYDEALKELKKIKAKGLADGGFIVAFKNSKKISVSEAKELLKD
ncbi:MAG: hypothetical protein WBM13_03280 [Bacteroidia bacterium]